MSELGQITKDTVSRILTSLSLGGVIQAQSYKAKPLIYLRKQEAVLLTPWPKLMLAVSMLLSAGVQRLT